MSILDWEKIKHFKPTEHFGDSSKMNSEFMHSLDRWRTWVSMPMTVLEGYATEGHAPKSYHYYGRAVDLRINGRDAVEHLTFALQSPFNGIGLYLWKDHEPFLHLDDRQEFRRVIWISFEKNVYCPFSPINLERIIDSIYHTNIN